jgi:prolyl-tRNA synthetase
MKMSKLVGRRIKEAPKDAKTVSHKFIIRGGYARPVSAGIYSLLPVGFRITQKIEKIIREEMDAIDGQEIKMPVVLPAELWIESGRYKTVGPELLRFKDRNDKSMLLGMTHEEAVVHLTRTEINSYKQLPVMLYQIQTKYRDEARPRAGLIRVREFTMKDAYSFHTSQECLDQYYEKAHKAYENIFRRVGMKDCISIKSNPGMMGGNVSHEFMAIADCGEDTIFLSSDGSYKANREVAAAAWKYDKAPALPLEKVHTPAKKTIEEVASFLGMKAENTGKAVFYIDESDNLIFAMIRGDFEVNESKLQNFLKVGELKFANDERIRKSGAEPGFASPLTLDPAKVRIVVDSSVAGSSNLIVGANEADYHYKNFNLDRDMPKAEITDIATAREGDPDPVTGQPLLMKRGIEVGNIFKLGTKYSESMNCTYIDQNGKTNPMIMGCYGIGVGRTMASVIEQSSDDYGPIWPISIAPYQVHICAITQNDQNVGQVSERIYSELNARGIEVLYDDRGEKPGFMFADADLLGIPFRIITSPKNLPNNMVEFKIRGQKESTLIPLDKIVDFITEKVKSEMGKYK